MNFTFTHVVDHANKILICEATGKMDCIVDLEHILKSMVKLSGKNDLKNIVFDATELELNCSSVDISTLLLDVKSIDLLNDLKIARVIKITHHRHNLIGELAEKLSLPIKNFETRSEALVWLLFDKLPSNRH